MPTPRRCSWRRACAVTLASIGDAVISIDVAGNITISIRSRKHDGLVAAGGLWTALQEVLRLIDGDSATALNPLAMAILHNRTVGRAHCVLIRRDGCESPSRIPLPHSRPARPVTGAVIFSTT